MKSSENQVLVLFSAIAGIGNNDIECQKTIPIKSGEFSYEAPLIKTQNTFGQVISSLFTYIVNPYFQQQSGPLQPKDEQSFFDMRMECKKLLGQVSEIVENAIKQVQERKQKENLTTRPI